MVVVVYHRRHLADLSFIFVHLSSSNFREGHRWCRRGGLSSVIVVRLCAVVVLFFGVVHTSVVTVIAIRRVCVSRGLRLK